MLVLVWRGRKQAREFGIVNERLEGRDLTLQYRNHALRSSMLRLQQGRKLDR